MTSDSHSCELKAFGKLSEHAVTPTQQVTGNFCGAANRMRPLRIFHGYLIPTRKGKYRSSHICQMRLSSKISAS